MCAGNTQEMSNSQEMALNSSCYKILKENKEFLGTFQDKGNKLIFYGWQLKGSQTNGR